MQRACSTQHILAAMRAHVVIRREWVKNLSGGSPTLLSGAAAESPSLLTTGPAAHLNNGKMPSEWSFRNPSSLMVIQSTTQHFMGVLVVRYWLPCFVHNPTSEIPARTFSCKTWWKRDPTAVQRLLDKHITPSLPFQRMFPAMHPMMSSASDSDAYPLTFPTTLLTELTTSGMI